MQSILQMKQTYLGIDIIEIERIREAIAHWGERFLHRVYTDLELELYRDKLESLAARFAGKEAAIKALSAPENAISWKEIEILATADGKPRVVLSGQAEEQALRLGLDGLEISLSHSRENAVAVVIGIAS